MKIFKSIILISLFLLTQCENKMDQAEYEKSRIELIALGFNYSIDKLKTIKEIDLHNVEDKDLILLKPLKSLNSLYLGKELRSIQVLSAMGRENEPGVNLKQFDFKSNINGSGLKYITGLDNLEKLCLGLSNCIDSSLVHLLELDNLKELDLSYSRITDDGLKTIGKLTQLEELYLDQCHITSEGVKHLDRLSNLKKLSLFAIREINDSTAETLKQFNKLEYLGLQLTSVTNKTLEQLAHLKKLKKLALWGAPVDGEGMMKLAEQLPNCVVTFERD